MRIREVGERKVMTFILGNETTLGNNKCIITYKVFITFWKNVVLMKVIEDEPYLSFPVTLIFRRIFLDNTHLLSRRLLKNVKKKLTKSQICSSCHDFIDI